MLVVICEVIDEVMAFRGNVSFMGILTLHNVSRLHNWAQWTQSLYQFASIIILMAVWNRVLQN